MAMNEDAEAATPAMASTPTAATLIFSHRVDGTGTSTRAATQEDTEPTRPGAMGRGAWARGRRRSGRPAGVTTRRRSPVPITVNEVVVEAVMGPLPS